MTAGAMSWADQMDLEQPPHRVRAVDARAPKTAPAPAAVEPSRCATRRVPFGARHR
eukprot:gene31284-45359_t